MKSIRFRFLAAALAVLLGTAIAKSQTFDGPPMHGHEFGMGHTLEFYIDMLGLTDAQQAQAKSILEKEKPTLRPLIHQLHQTQQQIHQFEQGNFDEAKVRPIAAQATQALTELMVQKARIQSELYQILTPDQQAKLAQFEANRKARMQKHMSQHSEPSQQ